MASFAWGDCVQNNGVPTLACIPHVFSLFVNALLGFVGTVSLIVIIYSGIRMILARGDAKELETAHKTFFFALLGLILVLLSFFIVSIIAYLTGVSCIKQFGFTNCSGQ